MDYLDYELMRYQEDQAAQCDICGEYNSEEWVCNCCHECERESCNCDEEDEILGI